MTVEVEMKRETGASSASNHPALKDCDNAGPQKLPQNPARPETPRLRYLLGLIYANSERADHVKVKKFQKKFQKTPKTIF